MSRICVLFAVLLVVFALSTVACADAVGPRHGCDNVNSNACR